MRKSGGFGLYTERRQIEFVVWVAGLILGMIAAAVLFTAYVFQFSFEELGYECWVRRHTGMLCPGCGGTRAFFAFLRGDYVSSFFFHPVVPYAGVIYIVFMLRGVLHFLSHGRISFMRFRPGYFYVAIGIILTQFLVKNTILVSGALLLPGKG